MYLCMNRVVQLLRVSRSQVAYTSMATCREGNDSSHLPHIERICLFFYGASGVHIGRDKSGRATAAGTCASPNCRHRRHVQRAFNGIMFVAGPPGNHSAASRGFRVPCRREEWAWARVCCISTSRTTCTSREHATCTSGGHITCASGGHTTCSSGGHTTCSSGGHTTWHYAPASPHRPIRAQVL